MLFCLIGGRWPPNFFFFVGACGPCEVFEVPPFFAFWMVTFIPFSFYIYSVELFGIFFLYC